MAKLLRQPLVHFVLIAAALFAIDGWLGAAGDDRGERIVASDAALREFLQYRSRSFDPDAADRRLAAMTDQERQRLVDRFVREEALYREARRLGLHRDDYVIKQRLVQKMEYLVRGFGAPEQLDEAAVAAYYREHPERYREPVRLTFAHVFVSGDRPAAEALARRLNAEAVPYSEATRHGERFRYHTYYVERSRDFVASHFGEDFAGEVFALQPDPARWLGPVRSQHGHHLIMVAGRDDGGVPPLDRIRQRVARDAWTAAVEARTEQAIRSIIEGYAVEAIADRDASAPSAGAET